MAADNEKRLLSKAIRERDINPILERGITETWFQPEEAQVFRFLLEHKQKYSEVPTGVTVKDNFPDYRLLDVQDSMEYLLDQMVAWHRRQAAIKTIQEAVDAIDNSNDHEQAINILSGGLAKIADEGVNANQDLDLTSNALERFDEYLELKSRPGGLLGVPTGFATIDKATAGLQPGQLVTIIAPPKTGKSVLAMQVAVNAHEHGHTPIFQSFEMNNREQRDRHDAMRAHISHTRLVRGQLNPDEETRYRKTLKRLDGMPNKLLLTDSISGMTVSALSAKIENVRPDMVFVDGVYLMTDEVTGEANTPQALTNITRNLKRAAQRLQVPIVISTQVLLWKMRKKQVSADSIGYSSSFFQDSDVILGLQRTEDDDPDIRILKIVASRNCGPAEVELLWDWEKGEFKEF